MPYFLIALSTAFISIFVMVSSATSKPPVLLLGDRATVNAIIDEVNLPDDRRGLVHVILEDARVRAERLDRALLPVSASSEPLVELPTEAFTMEQLDAETRSELIDILDEEQLLELHRAIDVILTSNETAKLSN